MQLCPELRIQTAIQSMTNIIIPAIDPDDSLAQEQAHLVLGMLTEAHDWLAVQFEYDKNELTHLSDAGEKVLNQVRGQLQDGAVTDLEHAVAVADDVVRRAAAGPKEVREAVRMTSRTLSAVVAGSGRLPDARVRSTVADVVMTLGENMSPVLRAAYAGHGFDSEAAAGPGVTALLAQQADHDPAGGVA